MKNAEAANELVSELVEAIEKTNNNWCIQIEADGYEYISDVVVDIIDHLDTELILRYDGCLSTIKNINFATRNDDVPGITEYFIGNSTVKITFTHSDLSHKV